MGIQEAVSAGEQVLLSDVRQQIIGRLDEASQSRLAVCSKALLRKNRQDGGDAHLRVRLTSKEAAEILTSLWKAEYALSRAREPVKVIASVARAGCLDILEHLVCERGYAIDRRVCDFAAREGHVEVLRFARRRGAGLNQVTAARAARGGSLHALELLANWNCPMDERACAAAAKGGHLHALRWLREEQGVKWDESTCEAAAASGDFDVLRYAVESGCPIDETAPQMAAEFGYFQLVIPMIESGFPFRTDEVLDWAYFHGRFDVISWFEELHDVRYIPSHSGFGWVILA